MVFGLFLPSERHFGTLAGTLSLGVTHLGDFYRTDFCELKSNPFIFRYFTRFLINYQYFTLEGALETLVGPENQ